VLRAGVPVRLSADYLWMAPAANLLFALLAVGIVRLLGLVRPRWGGTPVVLGVLTALLSISMGFQVESLHRGAVLLLALGIGLRAGRLAGRPWIRRLYVVVPPTALGMAALVAYGGVNLRRGEARRAAAEEAALPAAPAGAMNVLLLILDTVREEGTGLDNPAQSLTPALDEFARQGVMFQRAIAPAPWTLPSHASFFTGRLPSELAANWGVPLDRSYPTLAEYLAGKGYLTVGFVGNLQFATRASGLARGFIRYDDFQAGVGQTILSSSIGRALAGATWLRRMVGYHQLLNRRSAADVSQDFLDWQAREAGRPFFAFVNLFDAHEPYFPKDRSGSILWPGLRWTKYEHEVGLHSGANAWIAEKWTLSPKEVTIHAGAYHRAVSEVDREAGRLLNELRSRGALDHTVVIIAGDHGEQVGEHHLFEHINSLYLPTLQVPLIISSPRLPQGVRVPETVSLRDLPATVADLLGFSAGAPFPGRSLAAHWIAPGSADTVFSALKRGLVRQGWYPIGRGAEMFSLTTPEHHYIRNGDNSEELYDIRHDPGETKNLSGAPADGPILVRFRDHLVRVLGRPLGSPPPAPARP
jgi:arylsulfatase A-like enzyme